MVVVIFELKAKSGKKPDYLDIAAELKKYLGDAKGLVSIERFQSLTDSDRLLSLSFWENEEAVNMWRNHVQHRRAQCQGRSEIFESYHLHVAQVLRSYTLNDRVQAPEDSKCLVFEEIDR